jgi:flagellar M-ring protein FliF
MRFAELGVLGVVALLVLLFAVRPFIKNLSSPPPARWPWPVPVVSR